MADTTAFQADSVSKDFLSATLRTLPEEIRILTAYQTFRSNDFTRAQIMQARHDARSKPDPTSSIPLTIKDAANKWLQRNPRYVLRDRAGWIATCPHDTMFPGSTSAVTDDEDGIDAATLVIDVRAKNVSGVAVTEDTDQATTLSEYSRLQFNPHTMVYAHFREPRDVPAEEDGLEYSVTRLHPDILTSHQGGCLAVGTSLSHVLYTDRYDRHSQHLSVGFDEVIYIKETEGQTGAWGRHFLANYRPITRPKGQDPLRLSLIHRGTTGTRAAATKTANEVASLLVETQKTKQPITLIRDPSRGFSAESFADYEGYDASQARQDVNQALSERILVTSEADRLRVNEMMSRFHVRTLGEDEGPEMARYKEAVRMHRDELETVERHRVRMLQKEAEGAGQPGGA